MENWKKSFDQKMFVSVVPMDFSKALDSIPHDLPIAKNACILLLKELSCILLFVLIRRKQNFRINNTHSFFKPYFQVYLKDLYYDRFYSV